MLAFLLVCGTAQAQFGKRLGKAIENAAKKTVERKAEQKTEEAVGKTIDKATDLDTYKDKDGGKDTGVANTGNADVAGVANTGGDTPVDTPAPSANTVEMAYAKSDFVAGDEIIFDDDQAGERLGEFPSQWELHRGNAEIAAVNGRKVINMISEDAWIEPLMKTPKNYLGDKFTLEFDYFQSAEKCGGSWQIDFMGPEDRKDDEVFTLTWSSDGNPKSFSYGWKNSNGTSTGNTEDIKLASNGWNHVAVSFNKRALKIYINGSRIANVPNVAYPPGWVTFWTGYGTAGKDKYIANVRIARGAVPLYDRMMSDGKFVTYGITFDVGKSTIKPESMGEINRIVALMTDNPDLSFSVEGHTDATGNAAANQSLSEARSKAIVDKLVEMGIARDRLQSAGKGQSAPIADNNTDEGRAKNRRVEFVRAS
jgi:outer membrane protein OmpA-like peptidoglycan-associated protein